MYKQLLFLMAGIILAGAGCGGGGAPNVASPGAEDGSAPMASSADPCAALKTASGEALLTPPDAALALGGNWSEPAKFNTDIGCAFTLSSDEMPSAAYRFLFVTVSVVESFMYDEIVNTKQGKVANVANYEYKDVPNLGAEAFFQLPTDSTREFSTLLFVKKGNRIISIGSRYATEAQIIKLGQTATNRW
ncbi:MAG: hypothetical protein Q7K39_03310 [Candidatus Magasanikbacteria bacterium]|nr:hypothetical protein [Candidatus Magasanikbacteria bacterium]